MNNADIVAVINYYKNRGLEFPQEYCWHVDGGEDPL